MTALNGDPADGPTRRLSDPATADTEVAPPRGSGVSPDSPARSRRGLLSEGRVLADRYRIVRFIAKGGMGEVYEAEDFILKSRLALKLILPELSENSLVVERFKREILLARRVTHPNICRIYDLGSHRMELGSASPDFSPELMFLTMELLSGHSLQERLNRVEVIRESEALPILEQIAAGLDAAHSAGVIHRDLKSANIILLPSTRADGLERVVITDFGLARLAAEGEPLTTLSEIGAAMGTPAYMAPEQVQGKELGPGADIYALGIIAYEMVTGSRPFGGDTPVAQALARLTGEAQPPLQRRSDLDLRWNVAILRCLQRLPEDRFPTAAEFVKALRSSDSPTVVPRSGSPIRAILPRAGWRWGAAALILAAAVIAGWLASRGIPARSPSAQASPTASTTVQGKKPVRIVVLPFENLGAPLDAYFAAGMTEEISSRLANLRGLAVISRTTAIGYDRKGKTIKQIGAELGVDFVLEGTVRGEGAGTPNGRVRIAPELIQVADDTRVWADRYDRVITDILSIQTEVAENVVRVMGVRLVPREIAALKTASTSDLEAYNLYIRGLKMADQGFTQENLEGAIRLFQAAVDRDPRFSQALAQLAKNHLFVYFQHFDRSRARVDIAREAIEKLAALGPDLAETHIARAYYAYWGVLDYPRALQEFQAALALQPSSSEVLQGIGFILRRQGRWEESAEQIRRWVELDPRSPNALVQNGQTCVLLKRYAEADRAYALAASINPRLGSAWGNRGWLQVLWRGDAEKARSILSDAGRIMGLDDGLTRVAYASYRVALMRRDFPGALPRIDTRDALASQFYFFPSDLLRGQVQALMGQRDLARDSFEAARKILEQRISKEPEDSSRYDTALAIAFAGLGLREEALRAANRGVESMPVSKDLWRALFRIEDLALVYAMLGQQDEAISRLDFLLSHTGEISTHVLRLDPRWDPLRSNPRFQALLVKYAVKP
jgi:eukaryotic-like serine/threonine-protein kinase